MSGFLLPSPKQSKNKMSPNPYKRKKPKEMPQLMYPESLHRKKSRSLIKYMKSLNSKENNRKIRLKIQKGAKN